LNDNRPVLKTGDLTIPAASARPGVPVVSINNKNESQPGDHVSLVVITFWLSARSAGELRVILFGLFRQETAARQINIMVARLMYCNFFMFF
jgi:hypothetical protein